MNVNNWNVNENLLAAVAAALVQGLASYSHGGTFMQALVGFLEFWKPEHHPKKAPWFWVTFPVYAKETHLKYKNVMVLEEEKNELQYRITKIQKYLYFWNTKTGFKS